MNYCNKNFWKFIGGFLGILLLAIGALLGFQYWQNYKQEQELKTMMKELEQGDYPNNNPATGSPSKEIIPGN